MTDRKARVWRGAGAVAHHGRHNRTGGSFFSVGTRHFYCSPLSLPLSLSSLDSHHVVVYIIMHDVGILSCPPWQKMKCRM
jgi:hypothetical protein